MYLSVPNFNTTVSACKVLFLILKRDFGLFFIKFYSECSKFMFRIFKIYVPNFQNLYSEFSKFMFRIFKIYVPNFQNLWSELSKFLLRIFKIYVPNFQKLCPDFQKLYSEYPKNFAPKNLPPPWMDSCVRVWMRRCHELKLILCEATLPPPACCGGLYMDFRRKASFH